jgi:predicted nucleic acid-binding protein
MVDCMIATVGWRTGATLLAADADLDRVARIGGIDIDERSVRA